LLLIRIGDGIKFYQGHAEARTLVFLVPGVGVVVGSGAWPIRRLGLGEDSREGGQRNR
jgi:hypothetical protein